MMDMETIKAKLREMAKQSGDDALLPLVLLRLLEDGEKNQADLKAAQEKIAELQSAEKNQSGEMGKVKEAVKQLADARKQDNAQSDKRMEKMQLSLSEQIRQLAGLVKKGGWALIGCAIVFPFLAALVVVFVLSSA